MRQSLRLLIAASITVAAMGVVGCQSVPEQDMPGGILGGNDFDRQQQTQINSVDHSLLGAGSDTANPAAGAAHATAATKPAVATTTTAVSSPGPMTAP